MKKHLAILLSFSLVLSMLWMFSGCNRNMKYPEEGVWYCEEYQIQISFEPPEYESYVIVENEQVKCEACRERRDTKMYLRCIEPNNVHFGYREEVFSGVMIYSNDEKFILRGDDGTKNVFVRRD